MHTSNLKSNDNRNLYFDFLRGIAILLVIGIHTYSHVNFNSMVNVFKIIIRNIMNCAVPIFLAISGYFLGKKQIDSNKSYYFSITKQIIRIYFPMILWSIPLLVLYLYNKNSILKSIIMLIIGYYSIYYYISLQIQLYLIFPLLSKFKSKLLLWSSLFITVFALLTIMYLTKIKNHQITLYIYAAPFFTWLIFFSLGIYFARNKRNYSISKYLFLSIVTLAFSVFENYYWYTKNIPSFGIKLSSMFFSISVLFFLFSVQMEKIFSLNRLTRAIVFYGRNSFFIYLTHCYIIKFLNKLLFLNSWFIRTVCIITLCALFTIIMNKIIPNNFKTIIGLKKQSIKVAR